MMTYCQMRGQQISWYQIVQIGTQKMDQTDKRERGKEMSGVRKRILKHSADTGFGAAASNFAGRGACNRRESGDTKC